MAVLVQQFSFVHAAVHVEAQRHEVGKIERGVAATNHLPVQEHGLARNAAKSVERDLEVSAWRTGFGSSPGQNPILRPIRSFMISVVPA